MYDYSTVPNYEATTDIFSSIMAIMGVVITISMIIGIIGIISQWIIYKKAGKGGWEAIIPVYNIIVLLQIVELPLWYLILFIVPIANIYVIFKIYIELAHKFGKSTGFGVATVFFSFICLPILAFDKKCVYNGINNNTQDNLQQSNQENNINTNQQIENNNQQPITFTPTINTDLNPIELKQELPMFEIPQSEKNENNNQIQTPTSLNNTNETINIMPGINSTPQPMPFTQQINEQQPTPVPNIIQISTPPSIIPNQNELQPTNINTIPTTMDNNLNQVTNPSQEINSTQNTAVNQQPVQTQIQPELNNIQNIGTIPTPVENNIANN